MALLKVQASSPADQPTISMEREFAAPPAAVFAAWTQADRLIGWWRIPGFTTPADLAAVDPREGGVWSVTVVGDAGGPSIPFLGTLRVVDPPSYTVVRALDREGGLRVYAPDPAKQDLIWTELGFHHPLADPPEPDRQRDRTSGRARRAGAVGARG